jgi:histidinol-phosphate aminotransferase
LINMFDLNKILRENIKSLVPYSTARSEFAGKEGVFLDANENSHSTVLQNGIELEVYLNRYPDPMQQNLKEKLSKMKGISAKNIFLGNGSDEAIDLLYRTFCSPKDNVVICPPTYGMYEVSANINDIKVIIVPLIKETYQLDAKKILRSVSSNTKLIFICSPNNPTGNIVNWGDVKNILINFKGIVVVDEAYIDFAGYESFLSKLPRYPNLVILQTLSKAWGLAGLRIGMAFASENIITILNTIKPPYNINCLSQQLALKALNSRGQIKSQVKTIISERNKLVKELLKFSFVTKIYPSKANFILVKVANAARLYRYLLKNKIIIRDRSKIIYCEECLRITIGTARENNLLIKFLKQYES